MLESIVRASARIDAPPARVYGIIADYRNGHPHILPKQFRNLVVEAGGVGSGTIISFEVRAFGMTRRLRATITEPQPGRVLVETNLAPDPSVTTFTVEPADNGRASDVTIETRLGAKSGILGSIERVMSSRFLRSLYREELALLAAKARSEHRSS
jgi:Polyketide cyclase / dehydrase and lipid transport